MDPMMCTNLFGNSRINPNDDKVFNNFVVIATLFTESNVNSATARAVATGTRAPDDGDGCGASVSPEIVRTIGVSSYRTAPM
jgi:hypothetical protein